MWYFHVTGTFKKVFWLVISLVACGCLIFHMYNIFSTYFSWGTTVKLSVSILQVPLMRTEFHVQL